VDNQTVEDTFYAWMTGNTTVYKPKVVDCAYPCNPTCTKTAVSPDEAKLSTTKVNVFVNDY